jgi:hypothetical protein
MNFSKLPKEKRQHLILVILGTFGIMAGLGFGLIKGQYESLQQVAGAKGAAEGKLLQIQNTVKRANQLEAELVQAAASLQSAESDIASGDLYASVITMLRKFKADYRVDIPQFNPIGNPVDVPLLANFPYKQVTLTVSGTAHFHELGRFLADFENRFPHIRVLNLSVDPNPNPAPEWQETICFKMDVVTLVKLGAS